MASFSRTPSPAAGSGSDSDSAVATPMTPRTKMRELFATIDGNNSDSSSSDNERERDDKKDTPSRKSSKATSDRPPAKKTPKAAGSSAFSRVSPLRSTPTSHSRTSSPRVGALVTTSDDDSDVEIRPRGRFAARMQVAAGSASSAPSARDEPLAGNARERVKRMLEKAAGHAEKEPENETTPFPKNAEDTNDAEDEDEDGAPIAATAAARTRKRLTNVRASRRSPSAIPRQDVTPSLSSLRDASPGIFMTPTKHAEREASPSMFMTPTKGGHISDDITDFANTDVPGRHARLQALVSRKREEKRAREDAEECKRAARQENMVENANSDDDDEDMADLDDDDDLLMRDADDINADVFDISDDEGGRKLTQEVGGARPARKASKKALEEMHRETQRMSRNLQLTHEAKTRRKITKASLFERFNFKPEGVSATPVAHQEPASSSHPTSPASPQNNTDTEIRSGADTPPSSPPVPVTSGLHPANKLSTAEDAAAVTAPPSRVDKGKGKAVDVLNEMLPPQSQPKRQVRVRMPVSLQNNMVMIDSDDDGELEIIQTAKNRLDILFDQAPLKQVQEPRSMMALRRLAQITSPGRKSRGQHPTKDGSSKTMTLGELQQSLQERARRQAKMEREERLEMLRAKGIRIQTEEEREKEMEEVDDIVSRARQEAEELMQREREEAKRAKKRSGQTDNDDENKPDPLDWDDSEDEDSGDYEPEQEEEELELSGSEDEDADGEQDEDDEEETVEGALIDDEAESANESEDGKNDDESATGTATDVLPTPTTTRMARRRAALVLLDDDDDETTISATPLALKTVVAKTPGPKPVSVNTPSGTNLNSSDSPQVPTSVLRSATKPFIPGLPVAAGGPAGLGLTQVFAGTLDDDSQLGGLVGSAGFESLSHPMPTLGDFVEADFSQAAAGGRTSGLAARDSQSTQQWVRKMQGGSSLERNSKDCADTAPSQMVQLSFSQSQVHGLDSMLQEPDVSQMSELLTPSQDAGPQEYTPLKVRFIEHQPLAESMLAFDGQMPLINQQMQSPAPILSPSKVASSLPAVLPHPKGRLFRKADIQKTVGEDADEEEEGGGGDEEEEEEQERSKEQNADQNPAFAKMKQAAEKEKKLFDRKKSKAKEMIEEQAEESEDEYAGLGGADGEDSDDESLASVKDIIDDQQMSSADNAKLAAFYADRERENDEKQVEKLFRDVTTGMLRRKRGAGGGGDYDLSDSDDGGEARRRMKRRQFARMQKALFADERISKVAENPRNQAFMRTIEDFGSDDEMDLIADGRAAAPAAAAEQEDLAASTSASGGTETSQAAAIPDSQPTTMAAAGSAAAPQRTNAWRRRLSETHGKKPSNLGEIRETLSNLLEDYHNDGSNLSVVADSEFGSDNEGDGDDDDNSNGNKENQQPDHRAASWTRRPGHGHDVNVVDRITLKRNSSSTSTSSTSSTMSLPAGPVSGAIGFSATGGPIGFRGPTPLRPILLRRATANSFVSNNSSSGSGSSGSFATTGPGGMQSGADRASGSSGADSSGRIKKNASKMSGIHYFARENERRAVLAANEKRRQAKKARSAEGRSRAVGGLFGAGKFE